MNIHIHHYVNIAQEGINGNQRKKKYHSCYYDSYPKKEKNMYRITCMRRIFDEMSIQVSILKK